jgi:hypothetical protein
MTWTKGPGTSGSAGNIYSASCIVWRKDAPPLCRYVIQRVAQGKGFRWMLYQWNTEVGCYDLAPNTAQEPAFARLFHAKERADWLARKDARAGVKVDHSTPIEAAAAAFALCQPNETEEQP